MMTLNKDGNVLKKKVTYLHQANEGIWSAKKNYFIFLQFDVLNCKLHTYFRLLF